MPHFVDKFCSVPNKPLDVKRQPPKLLMAVPILVWCLTLPPHK